jgi:hypothetical protein
MNMLRFYVDFNLTEAPDVVRVRLDIEQNSGISERSIEEGMRVLLYDETMEIDAILRYSNNRWVGELISETFRDTFTKTT